MEFMANLRYRRLCVWHIYAEYGAFNPKTQEEAGFKHMGITDRYLTQNHLFLLHPLVLWNLDGLFF